MRGRIAAAMACSWLALASIPAMSGSAGAPRCRVIGGEKLPASSGGAQALCAAIEQAASAHAPGVTYSAEVRVISSSVLVAELTLSDGRKLPEQKYQVSDRKITRTSLQRFAEAIAVALGKVDDQ